MSFSKHMRAWGIRDKNIEKVLRIPLEERKPSECIELIECPIPQPNKYQVQVKILGAGLNFNSIWQSICHPLTPRSLIESHIRRNPTQDFNGVGYYIYGSDGAGIITAVGDGVKGWNVGDEVVIHCNYVDPTHDSLEYDQMKSPSQSIWGYETNFGSFADFTCVNASQLLLKPNHLNWAQAGSYMLTLATAYRMLLSSNGALLKPGEYCLIWGASGGLGGYAIQLCKLSGAIPVAIVSTLEKKNYCQSLGCDYVINLSDIGNPRFVDQNGNPNYVAWKRFKTHLSKLIASEVDVVFEHIGKETMGLSIYLLRKGGRVVTCAASSGYLASIDLRYLWMEVKSLIGSHFANYSEAHAANSLVFEKKISTTTEQIITFKEIPEYLDKMYFRKGVFGKIGVNI